MSTTDTPPDVATIETARETYLGNHEDATAQAAAWLTEAQIARDKADGLAARNDTGEHNGEIGRLHTHADGCHANGVRRVATAAAWKQEAANALHRITAMTRG